MTYEEMKEIILSNRIEIHELSSPSRFEATGLGIIDLSQIKYYGPIGLFEIYEGKWDSPNKKTIQTIVPSTDVDIYGTYYNMVKERMN